MAGVQIANFVDGFFRGYDWQDSNKQKKADRERQAKLDKMAEERHGITMERHNRDKTQWGKDDADYDRKERLRLEEEEFYRRLGEDMRTGTPSMGVDGGSGSGSGAGDYRNQPDSTGDIMPRSGLSPDLSYDPSLGNAPDPSQLVQPRVAPVKVGATPNAPSVMRGDEALSLGVGPAPGPYDSVPREAQARYAPPMAGMPGDPRLGYAAPVNPEGQRAVPGQLTASGGKILVGPPVNQRRAEGPPETQARQQAERDAINRRLAAEAQQRPAPSANQRRAEGPPETQERQIDYGNQAPWQRPSALAPAPQPADFGAITDDMRRQLQERMASDPNHQFFQPGGIGPDVQEAGKRIASAGEAAIGGAATAVGGTVAGAANAVNRAINPWLSYTTGMEVPLNDGPLGNNWAAPWQPAPAPGPDAAPQGAVPAPAQSAPAPDPAPEQAPAKVSGQGEAVVKQAEAASSAPAPATASNAGAKTAVQTALTFGVKPGDKVTTKQIERGSDAYVDRYYETVVPQMVQFYTERGEIDKAQKYIDLVESRSGKMAMKDMGKATFSIVNGDYDAAAQHMLSAFKRYGYADPKMDVDEEATGIVRDENGQPIGGRVVFRDRNTGNTFQKDFATVEEFIKYGHLMTSPETVVELLMAPEAQAKGALTEAEILKMAFELVASTAITDGKLTMEQAIQQVLAGAQLVRGGGAEVGQGGAPGLYRLPDRQ